MRLLKGLQYLSGRLRFTVLNIVPIKGDTGVCGFQHTEKVKKIGGRSLYNVCSVLRVGELAFGVHQCGFKFWLSH